VSWCYEIDTLNKIVIPRSLGITQSGELRIEKRGVALAVGF